MSRSSFKYAIFSQTSLNVNNNMTVIGDVYSAGDISVGRARRSVAASPTSGGGVSLVTGRRS